MADRLVTLTTFGSLTEAAMARNRLEQAGIPACLGEEETGSLFGGYMPAMGGVKLLVSEDHVLRAEDVLADLKVEEDDETDDDAEDFDDDPNITAEQPQPARYMDPVAITTDASQAEPAEVDPTSSLSEGTEPDPTTLQSLILSPADELAGRAFRAALIGTIFLPSLILPVILYVYSLSLLVRLSGEEQLSTTASRHVWIALVLDILFLSIGGLVILALSFRLL